MGENEKAVCVWKVAENGDLTRVSAEYNKVTGEITFETSKSGMFAVGYEPVALWENDFTDVSVRDWFYDAVAFANWYKLFAGIETNEFGPEETMTRAMFATVLYKLEMGANVPYTGEVNYNFTDIDEDAYFFGAVAWAAKNGLLTGFVTEEDSEFNPYEAITRQEMAVMFYNYTVYKEYVQPQNKSMPNYADSSEIAEWAADAVAMLSRAGVMVGKGVNTPVFDPAAAATRAEVAAMFKNYIRFVGIVGVRAY